MTCPECGRPCAEGELVGGWKTNGLRCLACRTCIVCKELVDPGNDPRTRGAPWTGDIKMALHGRCIEAAMRRGGGIMFPWGARMFDE